MTMGTGIVGQSVAGLGGVGKSELALHYAFEMRNSYTCIWWITADKPANVTKGLADIAGRLAPVLAYAPHEFAAHWATNWLQLHHGWLVVLDNVEDPADIDEFLAAAEGGHILVTTRRDIDWSAHGLIPVKLGMLTLPQAVDMLIARTGQADRAAAGRVAATLGCLPLALEQAAAYIKHHKETIAAYENRLGKQLGRSLSEVAPGVKPERAISQVWNITLEALLTSDPGAVDLLNVLAWLAAEDIPRDLVGSYARTTS